MAELRYFRALILTGVLAILALCVSDTAHCLYTPTLYARIAVTYDNSRLLNLALDMSAWPETILLYADTNLNNRFERSERYTGVIRLSDDSCTADVMFNPVVFSLPLAGSNGPTRSRPYIMTVGYRSPDIWEPTVGELRCSRAARLADGVSFELSSKCRPGLTLRNFRTVAFGQAPSISVESRPDPANKGNTAVVLSLRHGQWAMEGCKGMPAVVEFFNQQGAVVSREEGDVSRFTYPEGGVCGCSVRLQPGIYVAKTRVDTGLLAGVLESFHPVTVK